MRHLKPKTLGALRAKTIRKGDLVRFGNRVGTVWRDVYRSSPVLDPDRGEVASVLWDYGPFRTAAAAEKIEMRLRRGLTAYPTKREDDR